MLDKNAYWEGYASGYSARDKLNPYEHGSIFWIDYNTGYAAGAADRLGINPY